MNNPDQLVSEWLLAADSDYKYAKVGFDKTTLYANVCFSCQQSFEKYLKAFLITYRVSFPKSHDLTRLVRSCSKIDSAFDQFHQAAQLLTPYAVSARYPDIGDLEFSQDQAKQALQIVEQIAVFVKSKLSLL